MYVRIIGISFLICFGLQASNRDQWESYPDIQVKIDEILAKTGQLDHGENKLFAKFKVNNEQQLLLKCCYGPEVNKPFVNIKEEDGYTFINKDEVTPILDEIQNYLAQHLPSFQTEHIKKECIKYPKGVYMDGFRYTSSEENQRIWEGEFKEMLKIFQTLK